MFHSLFLVLSPRGLSARSCSTHFYCDGTPCPAPLSPPLGESAQRLVGPSYTRTACKNWMIVGKTTDPINLSHKAQTKCISCQLFSHSGPLQYHLMWGKGKYRQKKKKKILVWTDYSKNCPTCENFVKAYAHINIMFGVLNPVLKRGRWTEGPKA